MIAKENKSKLICIVCPMGCHLEVETDKSGQVINVTGNSCPRGKTYAISELQAPTRMLTSTVAIRDGFYRRLPVVTSAPVPKDRIFEVMEEIQKIEVCAPIQINAIIEKNICGLSVDLIASRSI